MGLAKPCFGQRHLGHNNETSGVEGICSAHDSLNIGGRAPHGWANMLFRCRVVRCFTRPSQLWQHDTPGDAVYNVGGNGDYIDRHYRVKAVAKTTDCPGHCWEYCLRNHFGNAPDLKLTRDRTVHYIRLVRFNNLARGKASKDEAGPYAWILITEGT